jgi:hypothetical protein
MRRLRVQAQFAQIVVGSIQVAQQIVSVTEVDADRNGYFVAIPHPVWVVDWDMDSIVRRHAIDCGARLQLRFVDRRVRVDSPESLDLDFRQHIAVRAVEEMHLLIAADLQKEVALRIHVIRSDAVGRGDKDNHLPRANPRGETGRAEGDDLLDARVEQRGVVGVLVGVLQNNPGAGGFNMADGFIDGQRALWRLVPALAPALANGAGAGTVVQILRPRGRGVAHQLHQPRQFEQLVVGQVVAEFEWPSVEVACEQRGDDLRWRRAWTGRTDLRRSAGRPAPRYARGRIGSGAPGIPSLPHPFIN